MDRPGSAGTVLTESGFLPGLKARASTGGLVKELQAEGFSERQRKVVDNAAPGEWGGEMPGHFVDGQQYMDNWTTTPQASFFTQVHAPGHFRESPKQVCDGAIGAKKCTRSVLQPDGGLVLFTEDVDWPFRVVYSYRPNGEVVWVQTDQDSAMTPEQAARVASDPEFTFTK